MELHFPGAVIVNLYVGNNPMFDGYQGHWETFGKPFCAGSFLLRSTFT
jgi:hypothetical protein